LRVALVGLATVVAAGLIAASAWLPVMFEQQADGEGSVPRVALAVAPELADETLSLPDSPAFWEVLGQAREADTVASILRALLPHVDAFLPVHNIDSLESLASVLAGSGTRPRREKKDTTWN
jgi:hypothetical protein